MENYNGIYKTYNKEEGIYTDKIQVVEYADNQYEEDGSLNTQIEEVKNAYAINIAYGNAQLYYKNASSNYYIWTINNKDMKSEPKSFYVIVQYPEYTDETINNYAYLSSNDSSTSSIYRIEDYDYVVMDKHKVSLEKFVSEVTDKNGQNAVEYSRQGYRHNEFLEDGNANKKIYKPNNPVQLENGDKVTYTIRLANTGNLPVKVDEIYDTFISREDGIKLVYDADYGVKLKDGNNLIDNFGKVEEYVPGVGSEDTPEGYKRYVINFKDSNQNVVLNNNGDYIDVLIRFTVSVPADLSTQPQTLINKAQISEISNDKGEFVRDADGTDNNIDEDHVITKTYAVSLEKFIARVNDQEVTHSISATSMEGNYDFNADGYIDKTDLELIRKYINKEIAKIDEDIINRINAYGDLDNDGNISVIDANILQKKISREGKAEHKYDEDLNTNNDWKYNNVVTVSTGDKVTYIIKVKNDGNSNVYITEITDYLPDGVKYNGQVFDGNQYNQTTDNKNIFDNLKDEFLRPGETTSFSIDVEVTEPNLSLNILKNTATISKMENRNREEVKDTTPNNNTDSDYIQLDYEEKQETTDYTVIKQWSESSKSTPTQVTVKLFKVEGNEEIDLGMESVVLSDNNGWTYTWKELPLGPDYIARELSQTGEIVKGNTKYNENTTTVYNENENTMKITNTQETPPPPPTQEKVEYTVEKVWEDDNNSSGKRPDSIKVRLFKVVENENEKVGQDITLNENNWTYTWTDLDKYDKNGKIIKYFVKELTDGILWTKEVVEEEESCDKDGNYRAYYLYEQNKTTITNKMNVIKEDKNDLTIAGIVWNDLALNKTQSIYDGLKDEQEKVLSGIKVMLYRNGRGLVAITYTNENGEYSFTNESLNPNLPEKERFIKGPIDEQSNRWDGTYYSYYVKFEYDGIIYTPTIVKDSENVLGIKNYTYNDSNAQEDSNQRQAFNNKFNIINKNGAYPNNNSSEREKIELLYSTNNENGYIPQSLHSYSKDITIQATTQLINLSEYENSEELLKHVNLGLRGRDTFDLELTSDVHSTKVTVNNIDGEYSYGNKVTVRREDVSNYNYREDSAHAYLQSNKYERQDYEQNVRTTDIINGVYGNTGLNIEVIYKIKVTNASKTLGTATKITNYYDSKYEFIGAYATEQNAKDKNNGLTLAESKEPSINDKYGYTTIETNWDVMGQSDSKEIYVVYKLKDASKDLKDIDKLATYNMSEIAEYTTKATNGDEATRGLIDKDSAPGSANIERVRLHPDIIGNESTVDYYFSGNDLSILKYEDDTYATPTLIFVKDNSQRTITGKVFRDETTINESTRIKTGNGKQDFKADGTPVDGERGVFGATVELIEQVEGGKVRYRTVTNKTGDYTFTGFLPGNYIIKYYYGDKTETVLLNQAGKDVNKYSFNGEDYQATNNIGTYGAAKLNETENYWYVYNESEGISTAKDNKARRSEVSKNVIAFTTEQMEKLNGIRKGENCDILASIIEATKMNAVTPNMLFSVEEKVLDGNNLKDQTTFGEYNISNMNFGLAEVPVTKIDLNKEVAEFTITDSTGENILAKAGKEVEVQGNVITADGDYRAEIDDEKLQGARLQITYNITSNIEVEKNFDGKEDEAAPTIAGLIDIVDNDLSYNPELNKNKQNWGTLTENEIVLSNKVDFSNDGIVDIMDGTLLQRYLSEEFRKNMTAEQIKRIETYGDINGDNRIQEDDMKFFEKSPIIVSSNEDILKYSTIVKATSNAIKDINEGKEVTITLEKVLSSTDATIADIITSNNEVLDPYVYDNIIEITKLDYSNVTSEDRIRTKDNYTILAGRQYDDAAAGTISIIPPWGGLNYLPYYIIAVISLGVLTIGIFGVRKFVLTNKK